MSSSNSCGTICISCIVGYDPAVGCCVALTNSCGKIICQKTTDSRGCATFSIDHADEYGVRAESNRCYSPGAQTRWFHLLPHNKYQCNFIFSKPYCTQPTGSLAITLRDENYPEYTLSKGVYTLWQIY